MQPWKKPLECLRVCVCKYCQSIDYLFRTSSGVATGSATKNGKTPSRQVVSSQTAQRERVWTWNTGHIFRVCIAGTVCAIWTIRLNGQWLTNIRTGWRSAQLVASHHQLRSQQPDIYAINVPLLFSVWYSHHSLYCSKCNKSQQAK